MTSTLAQKTAMEVQIVRLGFVRIAKGASRNLVYVFELDACILIKEILRNNSKLLWFT